jgi:hypothetical protein
MSDDRHAYAVVSPSSNPSGLLIVEEFDLTLPPDAIIEGIEVHVGRFANYGAVIKDQDARLMKRGEAAGMSKPFGDEWEITYTARAYGGATDLWDTTWTPVDLNNDGFGFQFAVRYTDLSGNARAYVDAISITFYYNQCQ